MDIALSAITIFFLFLIIFQFIRYDRLEKRAYEIKDGYFNLAIKKKLIDRKYFLRFDEKDLYKILIKILGDNFIVLPQIHLSDLAEVKVGYLDHDNLYYELKRIIYDYAIFDKEFNPLVLIELDGNSHFLKNRINRDAIAKHNANNLNIPFISIKKKDMFNKELIEKEILSSIKISSQTSI